MLGQRRRRWANIYFASVQHVVFDGIELFSNISLKKHEILQQCRLNVEPKSEYLAQHSNTNDVTNRRHYCCVTWLARLEKIYVFFKRWW